MMKAIIYLICAIIYMLLGASSISEAIDSFKKEKYGWFGWYIMLALLLTATLFKIVF